MKKDMKNLFGTTLSPRVRRAALVAMTLLLCLSATAQEAIRLTGVVTAKADKEPLIGVNISDAATKRAYAATDVDGRFAFNVHVGTTLHFSMVGLKTVTVKVKSAKFLEIQMEEENISLKEVVVAAKQITDKIMPEPTDIEVKGNYFHVRTRVRVPREMFAHNTRLVVQPILNDVTRGELRAMRPMVYDAREYNRTQDRLYNFDIADNTAGDPLARYITVKSKAMREKNRTNDIIGYSDSIYVEHVKDEFSCDVYMAIENYNRILYRDTTIIARGTVNPLRWLDYSFAAGELTDSAFMPKPEMQLRDSRGEVNLQFPIGKSVFDTANPQNAAEVEKMKQQLQQIASTKDATLQSLAMEGTSSPDGRYASNLTLAQRRMDFAVNYLRQQVPEDMRRSMKFTSKASVAPWTEVARRMRADSLDAEAAQVEAAIKRYANIDVQGRAIRRLPFYTRLIEGRYLPQLRKVGYVMNYSIFRQLTIDEIRELYNKDYKQLSRFEFFKLYRSETDQAKREQIQRQALEMYPSFMAAANDLASSLINRRVPDAQVLRPFAGAKAPQVVNTNQMIALLSAGLYTEADSVAQFVADNEASHLLLAVNAVLNGRYDDNFATVAKTGKRNELVMLLAMKRNKEAADLVKQLPEDEAITHYLQAVCLNRMDDPVDAYKALKKSFEMDPSLEKIARVDGDVNDLLVDKK